MTSQLAKIVIVSTLLAACAVDVPTPRPTKEEWEANKKDNAAKKAAAAADQSKMAAVDKVVSMLEDLQLQVLAEGEAEAATYNKFACFCKTTNADKSEAIKTGKSDKTSLSSRYHKVFKDSRWRR